ncbi:histone H3 [Temnothorax longispinosus]|uniref:Histone H3 n=1 Tax=Temnothorax longispinosus TaxID=300112 RepID=A0A4S2L629_9HYME|nr:histone H3 [Temnothorax longispinosus]
MDAILKHSCFGLFNAACQILSVDEAGKIIMTDINLMETTGDESLNDVTGNENNASEPQEVDEELISIVQQRPALYDPRIPLQERTKLKKKDLWQEVSNCLGEVSPVGAEKRWQYLRDCYTKARRNFKKIQSTEKRSGAAAMNDSNDLENRPPLTSPGISELSVATSSSRKRQHSNNIDEVDRAFLQTLSTNIQPNPIDGFILRLAEGMRRLPYRERSQLALEFLIILREMEEKLGLLNN